MWWYLSPGLKYSSLALNSYWLLKPIHVTSFVPPPLPRALQWPPLWLHSTPQMSTHACAPLDWKQQRPTVKKERRLIVSWFSNPVHHRQYPKLGFMETMAPQLYWKSWVEFWIQENQGEGKRSWMTKTCEYTGDTGFGWTGIKRNTLNKDREAKMQRMLSMKSSVWHFLQENVEDRERKVVWKRYPQISNAKQVSGLYFIDNRELPEV